MPRPVDPDKVAEFEVGKILIYKHEPVEFCGSPIRGLAVVRFKSGSFEPLPVDEHLLDPDEN